MNIPAKYDHKDGTHCWYCRRRYSAFKNIYVWIGRPLGKTIDHLIPQSRNGNNSNKNKISCCVDCNSLKANRTPKEFAIYLFNLLMEKDSPKHRMSAFLKLIMNNAWKIYNKMKEKDCLKDDTIVNDWKPAISWTPKNKKHSRS